jgi:hypothetical protein
MTDTDMTTTDLVETIRAAKARQVRELDDIAAVLPTLIDIQGRYTGSRDGNRIATQARKAGEAIETILSLTQGIER